jgi:hypothetical protein
VSESRGTLGRDFTKSELKNEKIPPGLALVSPGTLGRDFIPIGAQKLNIYNIGAQKTNKILKK